ncbi:hypothetical protein IWW50_003919, partial [Coemansia erecta]
MTEHETPRDWFYVCESHLQSASFCTASKETSKGATAQEPAPRAPAEEHKASSDDKDSSDATTGNKDEDTNDDTKTQPKGNSESEMPAKKPRYILSSHYFYLRQRPFIKRWEQQQAELLAKQLPRAPRHQPQRYFPGKAPQEGEIQDLSASESESENEAAALAAGTQNIAIARLAETRTVEDGSESESDSNSRLLQSRLRARQQAAAESSSDSDSDSSDRREQINRRELALLRQQQKKNATDEDHTAESSEPSSASESDSETDESDNGYAPPVMLKPMFVPKSQRLLQGDQAALRASEHTDASTADQKHERREESVRMAASEARRAREETEVPDQRSESMVDDSDDIDVKAEFEAWKLRELLRIKRDKEEQEEMDRIEAERERVRGMTEEERHEIGLERARKQREEKAQLRAQMAEEERVDKVSGDADDQLTRDMLEYAKKKEMPRASNSKWRGYRNEDTTEMRSLWAEGRRSHASDR